MQYAVFAGAAGAQAVTLNDEEPAQITVNRAAGRVARCELFYAATAEAAIAMANSDWLAKEVSQRASGVRPALGVIP